MSLNMNDTCFLIMSVDDRELRCLSLLPSFDSTAAHSAQFVTHYWKNALRTCPALWIAYILHCSVKSNFKQDCDRWVLFLFRTKSQHFSCANRFIYFDRIVYFLSYFEYKLALFSFINFYICFILNLYSSAGLCHVPVTLEVGCWNLGVTSLNLQDRLKVLQWYCLRSPLLCWIVNSGLMGLLRLSEWEIRVRGHSS